MDVYERGAIVAGKYRIDRVLGEGGMGVVVAATHLTLGTPVALKFLHATVINAPGVVERFAREARASAQLRSENVCRVSDVGAFDDGTPYIVMELLDGEDLASVLRANGPMPPQLVADYMLQACLAIAEAHQLGIVHRDLKPGNLFLARRPDGSALIKVLDFGVAKAPDQGDFSLTQTSNIIGSPGYMSPEQLRSSKEVDARSDIWSLGVVIYELLSGRQPFNADTITELTLRIVMDPVPALPPNVPRGMVEVVGRCLEKDAARRFGNVAQLAAALAPFAGPSGADIASGVVRVLRGSAPVVSGSYGSLKAGTDPTMTAPNTPTTMRSASGVLSGVHAKETSGRSWKLAMVIIVGIAVGVTGVIAATRGGTETSNASGGGPVVSPSPSPSPTVGSDRTPTPTPGSGSAETPTPTPAMGSGSTPTPTTGSDSGSGTGSGSGSVVPETKQPKPGIRPKQKTTKPKDDDVGESRT